VLNAGIWLPGKMGTELVLLLFAGFVSVVELLTVAVFESVPAETTAGATIVRLMTGAAPVGSVATVQVTTPATLLHVQPLPEALTKDAPAGSVSVTETVFATEGPAFETASVYVIGLPPNAFGAVVLFVIDKSVDTAKFVICPSSVVDRHCVAFAGSSASAAAFAAAAAFVPWPVAKLRIALVCPGASVIEYVQYG
jgi:hypothetical protein